MLDLSSVEAAVLTNELKGYPYAAEPTAIRDIGRRGWNVLKQDLPFPVALLKQSALDHNLQWMSDFVAAAGVKIAPHGKTTMAPQLFARQLQAGAWGMTLANMQQVTLCVALGLRRIIVANQLIGEQDLIQAARLQQVHDDLELYFLLDAPRQLDTLDRVWRQHGFERPCTVLIELGLPGGRTGLRTLQEALALARQVARSASAVVAGVECYEGLKLTGDSTRDRQLVEELMADLRALAAGIDAEGLFAGPEIILSAGGSAAFDLVARELVASLSKPVLPILRSGCYVTHDSGFYESFARQIIARNGKTWQERPGLQAALEVWTVVQSQPEPGLAILALGKRDASFDIHLPRPLARVRAADREELSADWKITNMNDQHAYLAYPKQHDLQVGELIGCGISHPCTTFDKWRWIPLVDDAYTVTGAIKTYF